MKRRLIFAVMAAAIACAGCSSSNDNASKNSEAAAGGSSNGGDFCELYANTAAYSIQRAEEVMGGNFANGNQVAADLLKEAPATHEDLVAAAPPEPRGYLEAAADQSKSDAMFDNVKALNDWAIANCDEKYRPVLDEYATYIG